jgi:AcrR family transcriptional regulator
LTLIKGDERSLVLSSVAELAASGGYAALSIARIRAATGVSRKTFDAHFDGVESCFLDAVELLVVQAIEDAVRTGSEADSWPSAVHRAIGSLCRSVARNPSPSQLVFVEILALGSSGLRHRERLISAMAEQLYGSAPPGSYPSGLVAEASVGATWDAIQHQVVIGRTSLLSEKSPTLSFLLLAPAIGASAAKEAIDAEGVLDEFRCRGVRVAVSRPGTERTPNRQGRLGAH